MKIFNIIWNITAKEFHYINLVYVVYNDELNSPRYNYSYCNLQQTLTSAICHGGNKNLKCILVEEELVINTLSVRIVNQKTISYTSSMVIPHGKPFH